MAHPLADPRVLLGRHRLDRTLLDAASGGRGCVHGTLDLVASATGGLVWQETGTLRWGTTVTPVSRRYRLELDHGWQVRFDDGRPFHPWAPGAEVTHPCAEDRYVGTVDGDPAGWRVRWRVTGPAKDLVLRTRLRRVG